MNYYQKQGFFSKLHIDWPLLIGIIAVSCLGLIILYSASKQEFDVVERQVVRLLLAAALMFGIAQIQPRVFRTLAPWLYFTALILLTAVLVLGHIGKGAQRWLDLSFFRFQPAELMKIAVPLMLAKYFEDRIPPKFWSLIIPIILILIPAALIAKQPDLGTAVLILSSGLLVIFFSGISWSLLFSMATVITLCLPTLWFFMHDYQRQRILVLLDPGRDPLGSGYHIIQSKIAIGSGGLYGKGWLNGSQSHLEFLPERTTDFIFAVFGEEFGLVGCLVLLALFLYIIIRGLYISVQAQDSFSRLLAGSLVMTLFVYLFVNIGMVTGILPVVGIPLPLVSYGGTSLVTLMASFGILMSIHTHKTLIGR